MTHSLLFSCVAENNARFATLVENLAISVRTFAGEHREAPVVALFVDSIEGEFRARLQRLAVDVEIVPRVAGGNPLANKQRMLELHERHEFEVLLGLDCDTIVVADPGKWADRDRIGAKAADYGHLTDQEWRRMFSALGLPMPARTLRATRTGDPLPPYFNSGVIAVPHALCGPLKAAWTDAYVRLSDAARRDPSMIRGQFRWLIEQASLGCGILLGDLPWHALPAEMNFPTHVSVRSDAIPAHPVILHYHHDHDARGFLFRSRTAQMEVHLNRFNRRRSELTGDEYEGIRRPPLRRRAYDEVAQRFGSPVADSAWYRSQTATRVRRRVLRSIGLG